MLFKPGPGQGIGLSFPLLIGYVKISQPVQAGSDGVHFHPFPGLEPWVIYFLEQGVIFDIVFQGPEIGYRYPVPGV